MCPRKSGSPSNASSGTTENLCERFYWICQDANYNVIGVVSLTGDLIERYEYTPYGQRTIFNRGWLLADMNSDGEVDTADYTIYANNFGKSVAAADLVMYPTLESFRSPVAGGGGGVSLCDIGHQGLMHDKEFGLIYNRARYLHPVLGRFTGRDPLEYVDGMSLYEYVRSGPVGHVDPDGHRLYAAKSEYVNVRRYKALNDAISTVVQGLWKWKRESESGRCYVSVESYSWLTSTSTVNSRQLFVAVY